jgi:hypothetical protein
MTEQEKPKQPPGFDRTLWLTWILVSTLGWLLSWTLLHELTVGPLLGIGQWLVLRSRVRQAGWWILASTLGWFAGETIIISLLPAVTGSVVFTGAIWGLALGIPQWFLLRRWFYGAAWWIVSSTLAWAIGPILGPSLVGAVVGAITGVTLVLIWPHRRYET